MTSTPGTSAALACIIAPWVAEIVAFLRAIVETILAIAENIRNTLPELGACCRKAARRLLALRPGLFRPMASKLSFLPPSASGLHALACKRPPEFGQGVMKDYAARAKPGSTRRSPSPQLSSPGAGSRPSWPGPNSMTILDAKGGHAPT